MFIQLHFRKISNRSEPRRVQYAIQIPPQQTNSNVECSNTEEVLLCGHLGVFFWLSKSKCTFTA